MHFYLFWLGQVICSSFKLQVMGIFDIWDSLHNSELLLFLYVLQLKVFESKPLFYSSRPQSQILQGVQDQIFQKE